MIASMADRNPSDTGKGMAMVGLVGFGTGAFAATSGSSRSVVIVLMYFGAVLCFSYLVTHTTLYRVIKEDLSSKERRRQAQPSFRTLINPPESDASVSGGRVIYCYLFHPDAAKLTMQSASFPTDELPGLRSVFRMRLTRVKISAAFEDTGFGSIRIPVPREFTTDDPDFELKCSPLHAKWKIDTQARRLAGTTVKWNGMTYLPSTSIKIRRRIRHYRGLDLDGVDVFNT
jgi:hypothetical protein